jgi:hypothetical protein
MTRKPAKESGKAHQFGGSWTTAKLAVLAAYLQGYTSALKERPSKERPFRKAYIDAFAGTGYREERREEEQQGRQGLLFPDLAEPETQELIEGSAKLALQTQPSFDKYIFIERKAGRCLKLEGLKDEFPSLAKLIDIRGPGAWKTYFLDLRTHRSPILCYWTIKEPTDHRHGKPNFPDPRPSSTAFTTSNRVWQQSLASHRPSLQTAVENFRSK